jgi:hypothetical protein
VVAVGLFEGGGLVIGQFQLERGDGFGAGDASGRADDRGAASPTGRRCAPATIGCIAFLNVQPLVAGER